MHCSVDIDPESIEIISDGTARARTRDGSPIGFKHGARTELLELMSLGVIQVRMEGTIDCRIPKDDRVIVSDVEVTPLGLDYLLPTRTRHLNILGVERFDSVRNGRRFACIGELYVYQRTGDSKTYDVSVRVTQPVLGAFERGKRRVQIDRTDAFGTLTLPAECGKRAARAFGQGLRPLPLWSAAAIRRATALIAGNLGFVCDLGKLQRMKKQALTHHLAPYDTCLVAGEPQIFYGIDATYLATVLPHQDECIYDEALEDHPELRDGIEQAYLVDADDLERICSREQCVVDAETYLQENPDAEKVVLNLEGVKVIELAGGELTVCLEDKMEDVHISESGLLAQEQPNYLLVPTEAAFEMADGENVSPATYREVTHLRVVPLFDPKMKKRVKRKSENVWAVVTEDGVAVLMRDADLRLTRLSSDGHLIEGMDYPSTETLMRAKN